MWHETLYKYRKFSVTLDDLLGQNGISHAYSKKVQKRKKQVGGSAIKNPKMFKVEKLRGGAK
jgi:hypothetical protein